MSSDDDGFLPARDESRDVFDDDWLSEDSSVEDVPDCAIGTLPHLLEAELLDSCLIGSDGGAFDAYLAFLDGLGSFNGDFVLGEVSVFDAEVEVLYF